MVSIVEIKVSAVVPHDGLPPCGLPIPAHHRTFCVLVLPSRPPYAATAEINACHVLQRIDKLILPLNCSFSTFTSSSAPHTHTIVSHFF